MSFFSHISGSIMDSTSTETPKSAESSGKAFKATQKTIRAVDIEKNDLSHHDSDMAEMKARLAKNKSDR